MRNENYDCVYLPTKDPLNVVLVNHIQVGRTTRITNYRVTSRFKLTNKEISGLQNLGFIGSGQSTKISESQYTETVSCVVMDRTTGKIVDEEPINLYTGEKYKDTKMTHYVYDVEVLCDSGD